MASPQEQQSWASQAALNALLKYAPQKAGLAELQKAAQEQFQESVQAGQTEGILGQQAARGAVAPTQQIYSNAAKSGEAGRNLVAPILAALSPNSPFKAAAANEQAAGGERLAQSQSTALSNLQQRSVAASELPAYTRSAATAKLLSELQKVSSKNSLLQGSEAADITSEVGKQRAEAAKQQTAERDNERTTQASERNSQRSSGASENNSKRSSGTSRTNSQESNQVKREIAEGKTPGGVKPASTKERDAALATFSTVHNEAKSLYEEGHSRAAIIHALEQPIPSKTFEDAQGVKRSTKGHAGYAGNGVMAAALDQAEKGGLQPHTEVRLHEEGYDPRAFGRPLPKSQGSAEKSAGSVGSKVLKAFSGF